MVSSVGNRGIGNRNQLRLTRHSSCFSSWMVVDHHWHRSVNATEECRNSDITDGAHIRRVYRRWPRRMGNARYSPRPRRLVEQSFSITRKSEVSAKCDASRGTIRIGWSRMGHLPRWMDRSRKRHYEEMDGRCLTAATTWEKFQSGSWNIARINVARAILLRHVAVIFQLLASI